MSDVKKELEVLDSLPASDVWTDAETRTPVRQPVPPIRGYERVAVTIAALVLAAGGVLVAVRAFSGGTPTAGTPLDSKQLYEANAFVMDSPETGVILCLGSVVETGVPQCDLAGVVPIEGWTWAGVQPEGSRSGARWGYYHVVGSFDGSKFTLTESPGPWRDEPVGEDWVTPCPEPEGGWDTPRPDASEQGDLAAASGAIDDEPDFAGLWADRSDPQSVVLNVAFTGNLAENEEEVRRYWGGPLCVVRQQRSFDELHGIQKKVEAAAEEMGLEPLTSDVNVVQNRVELRVLIATADQQRAMDERFGQGAVQLAPALTPA